jgi:hypothetical protein
MQRVPREDQESRMHVDSRGRILNVTKFLASLQGIQRHLEKIGVESEQVKQLQPKNPRSLTNIAETSGYTR